MNYGELLSLPKKKGQVKLKEVEGDKYCGVPFDEVAPFIPEAGIVDRIWNSLNESLLPDQLINPEELLPQ